MSNLLFKDRDGQTPLPPELHEGLKIRSIQTVGELDEYEEDNIARGLSWLERQSADACRYDFWLVLHRRLFGTVWSWAGKVRTHELANPDFSAPSQIWPRMYQLEKDLAHWRDDGSMPRREFAARFHEQIETIHPFANGNGRFGRIVVQHACARLEYEAPKWGGYLAASPLERRKAYIAALTAARRNGDYSSLIRFMYS